MDFLDHKKVCKITKPISLFFAVFLIFCAEFAFGADCLREVISSPTPFMGNDGEVVRLSNGAILEVKYSYEYMYEYYPTALVCLDQGFMIVREKKIQVVSINTPGSPPGSAIIESYIEGKFDGLAMGNVYKLSNGQIWEQIEPWIWVWVWVRPSVIIYAKKGVYKMKVENIEHPVAVRRLK